MFALERRLNCWFLELKIMRRNERRRFVILGTATSYLSKTWHGTHAFLYACTLGGIVENSKKLNLT